MLKKYMKYLTEHELVEEYLELKQAKWSEEEIEGYFVFFKYHSDETQDSK